MDEVGDDDELRQRMLRAVEAVPGALAALRRHQQLADQHETWLRCADDVHAVITNLAGSCLDDEPLCHAIADMVVTTRDCYGARF